ncbi:MAG: ABC transporter ATP-binding protein [Sphaerochaetaceae bacterium]|nr:ABC transporter ATP-binding protein [Sphaerochaetaceae bacterium]
MIEIKKLNYKYNKQTETQALVNINLEISRKEFILLCGRSGCGKSSLTKVINSLIPNYYENGVLEGEIYIDNKASKSCNLYEVSQIVSSVFQNPKTQFFNTNTTNELLFYLENRGFNRAYMREKLAETAKIFKIEHLFNKNIFDLSGGEKQLLAIAGAYASGTEIIILDEPSSNLDVEKTILLGQILAKLKMLGKTIIIAEHRFYFIKNLIDKVYYLKNGEILFELSKETFITMDDDVRKNLGLRAINLERLKHLDSDFKTKSSKQLQIQNMYHVFRNEKKVLNINNLKINFGNIVGIYGVNGIGKSTFIKIIMGLNNSKVKISINGNSLSSKKRLKKSYIVMQDVNFQLFTHSVDIEVSLGKCSKYNSLDVIKVLKMLNIYHLRDKHPMSLSGGQKQRVAIASAILSGSEIICFDEPTSGMDYDNMMRISNLIKSTINDNILIFIISHDHEFLNNTVDKILDMNKFNFEL